MAATVKAGIKKVNLEVGESNFEFHVSIKEFNTLQNEMLPTSKTTPSENFLMDTVQGSDDKKKELLEYLDSGYALELANLVSSKFKPELKITVKK